MKYRNKQRGSLTKLKERVDSDTEQNEIFDGNDFALDVPRISGRASGMSHMSNSEQLYDFYDTEQADTNDNHDTDDKDGPTKTTIVLTMKGKTPRQRLSVDDKIMAKPKNFKSVSEELYDDYSNQPTDDGLAMNKRLTIPGMNKQSTIPGMNKRITIPGINKQLTIPSIELPSYRSEGNGIIDTAFPMTNRSEGRLAEILQDSPSDSSQIFEKIRTGTGDYPDDGHHKSTM